MENKTRNNTVMIVGTVETGFEFNHSAFDEEFYDFVVGVKRTSGTIDHIKVRTSAFVVNVKEEILGKVVKIKGELRSRNYKDEGPEGRTHMENYLFLYDMVEAEEDDSETNNLVDLDCFICKPTTLRKTKARETEISDVFVAINRGHGHADHAMLLAWGRRARMASKLPVGTHLHAIGRLQSKVVRNSGKTVYEVSLSQLYVLEGSTTPSEEKQKMYEQSTAVAVEDAEQTVAVESGE